MNENEILKLLRQLREEDGELRKEFLSLLVSVLDLRENPYHPMAFINGEPEMGKGVYIGSFSEINAKGARVKIGDNCDIASFVSINVADSHKTVIGLSKSVERKDIIIENNVFIGSHSFIGGGVSIGHHSVVGAGTIISESMEIPPYSLVVGNPPRVLERHYENADSTQ